MRSLLITGASGFLGGYACRDLAHSWRICGTYCHHSITLATDCAYQLDLNDASALQKCWDAIKPDAVLHAAAISKVNQCQQDPDGSYPINVTAATTLAERCAAANIPFLFTSTDLVFDGTQPPYTETDSPSPINQYGEQKAIAEARILSAYPDATICRLPLMYGAATPTASCFLQGFIEAIAAAKTLNLFTDEIRTAAEVTDVVHGLGLVLTKGVTGIIHLGGPESINRYDFGCLMADAFHLPKTALTPCLQSSVSLSTPRPKDVSLDSQRAFAMGYAPRRVKEALRAIAAVDSIDQRSAYPSTKYE